MAKREPKSLFRRLTRLFRSGPVVKRKIRALDTTLAVADKTKSSGTLLFQKSLSPTYATITSNAYNLSERLMRYQDFQEMEYSVSFHTLVATSEGLLPIGELAKRCDDDPERQFIVYSYDHIKRQIVPAFGKQARQTCVDHAWKVTFDNGKTITASPEHRLMLRDGTYRRTEDLKPGDAMMPFYRKDLFANAKEGTKGYSWVYTMDERFRGWTKEHQLIAEWVAGRKLAEDEVVHHINFIKTDNRPENLQIMTKSDHDSYHAALNNAAKWAPENHKWIEEFKKNHAIWMRDNAPTRRHDVTFARILETCERFGFRINAVRDALDVSEQLINERLVSQGFATFTRFVEAYASGLTDAMIGDRPGLLTRDLSIETIKRVIVQNDTKRSICIKLGCTVNVLDKFLARRAQMTWSDLRRNLGYKDENVSTTKLKSVRKGGRPKGTNGNDLTFQQICDAYTPGLTLPRLSEKLVANKNTIISRLAQNGFKKFSDFQSDYGNCKVVSVEYVGVMPLFDLTVDGYKNFATDSVISHNTPEIAAAMDIYADETVAADEKGKCLHVYSDNEKIRELLEDLFYNVLNVEFNLRSWARNLCKYGDFFLYNDVSPEYGVVNAFPIPVNEIEREENYDRDDPFAVRYRWVTLGNRTLENWEVTHFRLLGNDMFLPYGSSIIEPARRIWRQLILIEDAMLVYRVVRAPERRVFYIDVANIPADQVNNYVEQQRQQMRTAPVVDSTSGRVDLRYNPMPVHWNSQIPLLDGRTVSIKQLSEELASGEEPWVYSVQDDTHKVVPGKVIWCGKNYSAVKLTKVWLDDGSYVMTAPEHPFVMRDGSKRRADELTSGDNLMPLYRQVSSKSGGFDIEGYETVYDPSQEKYVLTHRLVANSALATQREEVRHAVDWTLNNNLTVHHVDVNRRNNSPVNLRWMGNVDHIKLHATMGRERLIARNKSANKKRRVSELNVQRNSVAAMAGYNGSELHTSHNASRSVFKKAMWADPTRKTAAKQNMCYVMTDAMFDRLVDIVKQNPKAGRVKVHQTLMADQVFVAGLHDQALGRDVKKYSTAAWEGELVRRGYAKLTGLRSAVAGYKNHSVVRVEHVNVAGDDVYCMTVVGPQGEDDRHNFAVLGLDTNGLAQSSGIFVNNSVEEDFFIPVRGDSSGTKIDTLAGGQNTAAVEDVAYIQKKLFAALKIPRAYLGYDELLSSKATLAQEDIRFSRTINVIQKTMMAELNKLAIIHLYAHGFDNEDLQNFTLRLSNPSTVAQQQKLELWRARFEIAGSAPEGMGSKKFIRTEILGLNEEQIEQLDEDRMREKLVDAKIEGAGAPDEGGEGDAGGEADIFGGAGGEEPAGGEEAGGAPEETPPEENAGEEPEEDVEPETELLTSEDDRDDDEQFSLKVQSLQDNDKPVKPKSHLQHALYNRGRRRHHGASTTHMPDFQKMTSTDNRAMQDPYDQDFLKSVISNPFAESHEATKTRHSPVKLGSDVASSLRHMRTALNLRPDQQAQPNVLTEGKDVQDEIDEKHVIDIDLIDKDASPIGQLIENDAIIIDDENDE